MKKGKILILMLAFLLVVSVGTSTQNVFAEAFDLSQNSATNKYTSTGVGSDTDHSYYNYYVGGTQAYCIEAGVKISKGANYGNSGPWGDGTFSWIIENVADPQDRQAAIWQLCGKRGYNNSHLTGGNISYIDQLITDADVAVSARPANTSINVGNNNLWYDRASNRYYSDWFQVYNTSGVGTNFGWLEQDGDNYRLVANATDVGGDTWIVVSAGNNQSCKVYDAPTLWTCGNLQKVITPNSHIEYGAGAEAGFNLHPIGDLKIIKRDNHGQVKGGAQFHIWGPGGDWWLTTDDSGEINLQGINLGEYTIEETQAPDKMTNEEAGRVGTITVTSGSTATYTRTNPYPRGSVRILKYDKDNRDHRLGESTLAGAKIQFYAAEDIYEGVTKIYSAGQWICERVTKEDGNTDPVTNLPIGNYYYLETEPAVGYNLNSNKINVSVPYAGQFVYVIPEQYVELPEEQITGNIEITKRLGALDYDPEINLKGARFKITSKKDSSQVYYTNYSGDDGKCVKEKIPYGDYVVEECDVPNEAEKVPNFDVSIREQGKTYKYTKVDPSKDMKIEVYKNIHMAEGEKTDAKAQGAVFTVFRDANCRDKVCEIGPTDVNGYAISGTMRTGRYYVKETKFPVGIDPYQVIPGEDVTYIDKVYEVYHDNRTQGTECVTKTLHIKNEPNRGDIEIYKTLSATDYDPVINLEGAKFRATLKSDRSFSRDSGFTDSHGIAKIESLPYGTYEVEEIVVPDSAYKIQNFDLFVEEDGKVYTCPKEDQSKMMKIQVNKLMKLREGEATDATTEGAVFTVYLDEQAKNPYIDKNGNVVKIGPTDANGYAISKTMRTGTYYLKETTFPVGIDPDCIMEDGVTKYKDKVYTVSYDNRIQGTDVVTVELDVENEPVRNHVEIFKEIGKTSNTPQFPIDQCKFTATLISTKGTDHVFSRECTAETTRDTGYCIIEDLPYGEYEIEETKVSPITLKCDNFTVFVSEDKKVKKIPYKPKDGTFATAYQWLDDKGAIVDIPKVMQIKIRKVDADRKEDEAPDRTRGDAVLKGAVYEIYRYDPQTDDYTEFVYNITVDHKDSDGYWCAESKDLLVGKYRVQEVIEHSETVNGKTYDYSHAEGYLVDPNPYFFEVKPDTQTVERTYHYDTSVEEVIRGSLKVIKYNNIVNSSQEAASKGAILKLHLDSAEEEIEDENTYFITIDENGYGEFIEEKSKEKHYPCTIPYGKYTITEVRESDSEVHTSFFIQPEPVEITKQVQKEYRIEDDEPVQFHLKIQKRDKDSGETVELEGAKFKIWDIDKEKWVTHETYPSGEQISEFTTEKEGYFVLPEKIEAGEFIVYETQAPKGYYLEEEFRLPEDSNDIGVIGKGGKYVKIKKSDIRVEEDTPYHIGELYYTLDMANEPLKAKFEIVKKGEMLSEVQTTQTRYGDKYTPKYSLQGLNKVTYEIYAAEDIKSPDGRYTYVKKGRKVDTITTQGEGTAITKELYPGEYEVKETVTPIGFVKDETIPNVVLTSDDTLKRVETHTKELTNKRQKLEATFKKLFEDVNYSNGDVLEQKATFGIFANETINNFVGMGVINKDDLIDVIEVEGNDIDVTSTIDLPEGKYYIQELDASFPYTIKEDRVEFTVEYNGVSTQEFVVKELDEFVNEPELGSVTLVKLSSSILDNVVLNGNKMDTSKLDEKSQEIINQLKGLSYDQIKQYYEENHIEAVPGAKYRLYTDSKCENELRYKDKSGNFVTKDIVTNELGIITLEDIPLGIYYLKEIEAPAGYEVSDEITRINLTSISKNAMVYQALLEESVKDPFITKTDIFTGEKVPNCTFMIKDEDDNIIVDKTTTDENGEAYLPISLFKNGKTYKYIEIDAPDVYKEDGKLYKLNTEPHEFVAKFDEEGNWIVDKIPVENRRPTVDLELTKLDMVDSTPIPNCKFELKSLETDFKVEGVTDENGVYVFKDIPFGKYTYTELEAPEEYLIDTTPHEITIDSTDMKIVVYDERNPDTGDIAVVVLGCVALVSIVGIIFVIVRNKKNNSKKD